VSTHNTTAQVRGVSWCGKNQNHPCTHDTRFKNTAGLPVPILNPICTWYIVLTYNYSPYLKWKCYFYFWQYLKYWLVLLSILHHMQSSIVCYCLYNIWIVVSQLFLLDVEVWLIQIPIFEVKHCIWALILLQVEIVVICQFLLKILVSHINFSIKSPYIVKLLQCGQMPEIALSISVMLPKYWMWQSSAISRMKFSLAKTHFWSALCYLAQQEFHYIGTIYIEIYTWSLYLTYGIAYREYLQLTYKVVQNVISHMVNSIGEVTILCIEMLCINSTYSNAYIITYIQFSYIK